MPVLTGLRAKNRQGPGSLHRLPFRNLIEERMKKEDTLRKCIVSGRILEKKDLLRFTLSPELEVIPDFKKKLPGKGLYVTNSMSILKKAIDGNVFAKVLKRKAKVDPGLAEIAEQILRKRALDAVSLARKAGCLVTGMEKVAETLKKDKVAFLLEAVDAGKDGRQKVARMAGDLEVFKLFEAEELDKALNKTNTVHAAFLKGSMAEMVREEFNRLSDFLNS